MTIHTRPPLITWPAPALLLTLILLLILLPAPSAAAAEKKRQPQPGPQLPAYTLKMYRGLDGKLYVPGSLPVKLSFSSGADRQEVPAPAWTFTKEGKQLLSTGGQNGEPVPIYVDLTPPSTELQFLNAPEHKDRGNTFYGKGVVFRVTTRDTLSGVRATFLSINGSAFVLLRGTFQQFTANSTNIVRVLSVDHVGNRETLRSRSFFYDTTPPVSSHKVTGPAFNIATGTRVLSPRCIITLSATDTASGLKGIYYRLDNGPEIKYQKALALNKMKPGKHSLIWASVDNVGNREELQRFDFNYDDQAPMVSLLVEGPSHQLQGSVFISAGTRIKLEAKDNRAGTAAIHYRIDSGKKILYTQPILLTGGSGLHKVGVTAVDNVTNRSQPLTRYFYLDTTPPESEFKISGFYTRVKKEFIIRKEISLQLSAADLEVGVGAILYQVNGGDTLVYSKPIGFEKDGQYRLAYWSRDHVGNTGAAKTVNLRVDNAPAKAGFHKPPARYPKQWYQHPDGRLIGAADLPFFLHVGLTGKDGKTIGNPIFLDLKKFGGEVPITFKKGGVNSLTINTGLPGKRGSETVSVLIDSLPPRTAISFSGKASCAEKKIRCYGPGLQIRFKGADTKRGIVSGFKETRVSVDDSEFFTYTKPLRIFSREKTYRVEYFSVDNVGNAEKPHTVRFAVDATPPVTTRQVGGIKSGRTLSARSIIQLSCTDNHSGVRNLYFNFDGTGEKIYRSPLTGRILTRLSEGTHTLRYFSVDHTGNREEPHSMSFLLDHNGPAVRLRVSGPQHIRGKTLYLAPGSRVHFSAADPGSQVKSIRYRIDGQAPRLYRAPLTAPTLNRRYQVGYSAEDNAGNNSPWKRQQMVVDATAPVTQLTLEGAVFRDKFRFYAGPRTQMLFSARDQQSGVREILCSVDNNPFKAVSRPFFIQRGGAHKLRFRSVDNVGNIEAVASKAIYIDNTPPTLIVFYSMRSFTTAGAKTPLFPANLVVSFTASDTDTEVDKIVYHINGGRERLYRNPLSHFENDRDITLTIYAYDRLGNRAQKTVTFRVEKGD